MEDKSLHTSYKYYENFSDLLPEDQELYNQACDASTKSYAPYSNLNVGAAIRFINGRTITGHNHESGAYPSGMCAERVALYNAVNDDELRKTSGVAIAIAARMKDQEEFMEISPCGQCRQVLAEYAYVNGTPLKVILPSNNGAFIVIDDITALLPFIFNSPKRKKG